MEILVVLLAFTFPNFVNAFWHYLAPGPTKHPFAETELLRVMHIVSITPILVWVAWRSGVSLQEYGVRSCSLAKGIGCGALAWLASEMIFGSTAAAIQAVMPDLYRSSRAVQLINAQDFPHSAFDVGLLVIAQIGNAFLEEFAMRGYLIPRLKVLTRGDVSAVLLSSLLFASYHIYQGPIAVIGIFIFGLAMSVLLLFTGSIWPGVVVHTAMNVTSYLGRMSRGY